MDVREATTEAQIRACFPVVTELRPHLDETGFVERVDRQRGEGYRLAYIEDGDRPVAVAGFRVLEMLSRGRFLYVDDLVTRQDRRGEGYGTRLLDWLEATALAEDCEQVDLDSGFQRKTAHRFYLDNGMEIASLHFSKETD